MGFAISLKGKGPKNGDKLKAAKRQPMRNALKEDSDSDGEEKKTEINSYDASAKEEVPQLVIRPQNLTRSVIRSETVSSKVSDGEKKSKVGKKSTSLDAKARSDLLNGEDKPGMVIPMNLDDDDIGTANYDEVPIEDFGAAMLRGMGWKPKKEAARTENIDNRKRGLLLGIGAQQIKDNNVSQELLGSNVKFTIPVIRREKRQKKE